MQKKDGVNIALSVVVQKDRRRGNGLNAITAAKKFIERRAILENQKVINSFVLYHATVLGKIETCVVE
ncbi:MAG: hypothetical protein ABSB18_07185 [Candidatus Omnitrophota bacterium]